MSWLKDIAIGVAVLSAAGLVFVLVIPLPGAGVAELGQQIREQGNRWLLPVRAAVYLWAVWVLPRVSGFTGARLRQLRITLAAVAAFIELVAVQRLFVF